MSPGVGFNELAQFFVGIELRSGRLFGDDPAIAQRLSQVANVLNAFDHRLEVGVAALHEVVERDIRRIARIARTQPNRSSAVAGVRL